MMRAGGKSFEPICKFSRFSEASNFASKSVCLAEFSVEKPSKFFSVGIVWAMTEKVSIKIVKSRKIEFCIKDSAF